MAQIFQIRQLTTNFGKLETSGIDFGIKYLLRGTSIGDFRFCIDATYIDKYDSTVVPGTPVDRSRRHVQPSVRQLRRLARYRGGRLGAGAVLGAGLGSLHRRSRPDRSGRRTGHPAVAADRLEDLPGSCARLYVPENTKIQLTVDNLTNEEPPLMYQNNVLNSNTDVSTYDLIGTYYRVSLSHKF